MEPPLSTVVYIARLTRSRAGWSAVVEGLPGARVTCVDLVELHDALRDVLARIVDDDAVDVEYLTCCIPAGGLSGGVSDGPSGSPFDLAPTPCFAA